MEKKTYETPCMKVREISAHVMLNTSGENNLRMISTQEVQEADVEDEISQW